MNIKQFAVRGLKRGEKKNGARWFSSILSRRETASRLILLQPNASRLSRINWCTHVIAIRLHALSIDTRYETRDTKHETRAVEIERGGARTGGNRWRPVRCWIICADNRSLITRDCLPVLEARARARARAHPHAHPLARITSRNGGTRPLIKIYPLFV